jgi:hypothetical protein
LCRLNEAKILWDWTDENPLPVTVYEPICRACRKNWPFKEKGVICQLCPLGEAIMISQLSEGGMKIDGALMVIKEKREETLSGLNARADHELEKTGRI